MGGPLSKGNHKIANHTRSKLKAGLKLGKEYIKDNFLSSHRSGHNIAGHHLITNAIRPSKVSSRLKRQGAKQQCRHNHHHIGRLQKGKGLRLESSEQSGLPRGMKRREEEKSKVKSKFVDVRPQIPSTDIRGPCMYASRPGCLPNIWQFNPP
jgi:hypothetical protein